MSKQAPGTSMICNLAAAIICNGTVTSDWEQSFIVCLCKGKGVALDRGNYCHLSLTEQVMKVLEDCGQPHQTVGVIRLFTVWLRPWQRHNRCNLVVRLLQKKYLAANKRLYMAFVDL